jgi:hypothetical protein
MDGTRVKRWWIPSLQVRFPSKFRRLLKTTPLNIFFQRVPGQPPLLEHTEEDTDNADDAADDDNATVASTSD